MTGATGGGFFCSAAAWGPNVHVVYVGADEGSSEVYYTRSRDGGATWSAPLRLSPLPDSSYTPTNELWLMDADGANQTQHARERDSPLATRRSTEIRGDLLLSLRESNGD